MILLKSVNSSDNTFDVTSDASLPASNGLLKIESEEITYTDNYMGTLYGVVRGANSTSAASHTRGVSLSIIDFYSASGGGSSFPLVAPDGSAAAPSYNFTDAPTTGMYYDPGTDPDSPGLAFTTEGVLRFIISGINGQTKLDSSQLLFLQKNGTQSDPALRIGDANDVGLFAATANTLGIECAGGEFVRIGQNSGQSGITINSADTDSRIFNVDGVLDRPAYTFSSDHSIGMWSSNVGQIVIQATSMVSILAAADNESGRFDDSATAGDTRFMLWDVDSGVLQRVTVGANDSGGTGFKVLRIPNS